MAEHHIHIHLSSKKADERKEDKKREGKVKHMKPEGKKGKAQVKRLGRSYKTGGFNKIAKKAAKEYGSAKAGKKVAGAIFGKMAKEHAAKVGGMSPSYAKKV